jgi:DNA polymerase elongation subunit (family B)
MPTLVLAVSIYGYYVFMNTPRYGCIERGESSAKFE